MPVAAVFLDRDNTLIQNDGDLGDPDQVVLIKGVASAIASLRGLGYKIIVVTNQGGVARGKYSEQDVDAVHQRINEQIKATTGATIDRFYFCPYHPKGKVKKYRREHPWRKPQPGMLLQAAEDLNLDLDLCWLVGDQLRDIESAKAAGVRAILLHDAAKTKATHDSDESSTPNKVGGSNDDADAQEYWETPTLIEAVKIIAKQGRSDSGVKIGITPGIAQSMQGRGKAKAVSAKKKRTEVAGTRTADTETVDEGVENTGDAGVAVADGPESKATSNAELADTGEGATGTTAEAHGRQSHPRRPFRPWLTQPADGEEIDPDTDVAQEQPAKEEDHSEPEETPEIDSPEEDSLTQQATPAVSVNDDDRPAPVAVVPAVTSTDRTLSQILQELRNRRAADMDFSYQHTFAIVLQMVAGVCLLGALWMGGSDFEAFVRWIGVGLVLQLATIAMLIFRR